MKRKTSHPRNLPQILLLEQLAVKKKVRGSLVARRNHLFAYRIAVSSCCKQACLLKNLSS
jgi:hypothetical protein